MKCNEVMTKNPVYCLPTDNLVKVAQLMKNSDIGAIPIIENEETKILVGILSDRDLVLKILAEERDPQSTKVEDVMSRKVITCQTDDDLEKALDLMAEHQLRRIPIIDGDNRIVGIIAQADVATRLNQPEKTGEIVKDISQSKSKLLPHVPHGGNLVRMFLIIAMIAAIILVALKLLKII